MPRSPRMQSLRLLWAAVRRIPDGEEALRAAVARINQADGTNAGVLGAPSYSSTKLLSELQLFRLAQDFRRRACLPAASQLPRGPRGGRARRPPAAEPGAVSFMPSAGERDYMKYLFDLCRFNEEGRNTFVLRQTKGQGLVTHALVNAVLVPLERILRSRGWTLVDRDRSKRWIPPKEAPQ